MAIMQAVHAVSRREAAVAGLGVLLLSPAAAQAGLLGGGPDKNEVYSQDTVSTRADFLVVCHLSTSKCAEQVSHRD